MTKYNDKCFSSFTKNQGVTLTGLNIELCPQQKQKLFPDSTLYEMHCSCKVSRDSFLNLSTQLERHVLSFVGFRNMHIIVVLIQLFVSSLCLRILPWLLV